MSSIAGAVALRPGVRLDVEAVSRMIEASQGRRWGPRRICGDTLAVLAHRDHGLPERGTENLQPATDPITGTRIVLDGHLYNGDHLRRELASELSDGRSLDPHLVLAAYTRWGEGLVEHLEGEFAFVLADLSHRTALMARDHLGIKPLYLAHSRNRLLFASTLPALLAAGGIDTSIDPVGLHHYLSWHSIVPAPRTILRGVQKLQPATLRVIDADGIRERVYWQPDYSRRDEHTGWSRQEWTDATHTALLDAVRRRLPRSGPVSVLLSGGLDSSLLVALLSDCHRGPINTFSIGFDSAGELCGDEFAYSSVVARRFGTNHHALHVRTRDLVPAVVEAVSDMTEPMGTRDATAFHLLARQVSDHSPTVMCGQGADEVFAGYRYHQHVATADRASALHAFNAAFLDHSDSHLRSLVSPGWLPHSDPSQELLKDHLARPGAETALDAVTRLDVHLLMIDDPVKRVDSMSRPWGLQAAVPFLDRHVVELAAACPPSIKLADDGKGPLKALGRNLLPHPVTNRPKGYFPVPALTFLQGPVMDLVRDTLQSRQAADRGLWEPHTVEMMLASPNQTRNPTGGNPLWQLAVLEMWLQHHTDTHRDTTTSAILVREAATSGG